MAFERLVGKDPGRAYLDKITAEFVFENAILMPAKVYVVMRGKDIEITPACVIPVKSDAPVTLNAAVHFVVNKRAKVLVPVSAFFEPGPAVIVSCHYSHILEVAFSSFIANRTVMRVIEHKELDYAFPESQRFRVVNRDAQAVRNRRHAGHYYSSALIMLVFKLFHGTLPAGPYRMHRGMPAEIWYVEAQGQACMEQVVPFLNSIRLIIYINIHFPLLLNLNLYLNLLFIVHFHGQRFSTICLTKSSLNIFSALLSGSIAPGANAQKVLFSHNKSVCCCNISRSPGSP